MPKQTSYSGFGLASATVKPTVVLFSEDKWLFHAAQNLLSSSRIELHICSKPSDLEINPACKRVFLVDLENNHNMPVEQIVAQLAVANDRAKTTIFLVSPTPLAKKWQNLATIYNVRDCILKQEFTAVIEAKLKEEFAEGREKRKGKRVGIYLPVTFSYLKMYQRGICSSLSKGGAFIQSGFRPHKQARITVRFFGLPEGDSLQVRGSVIYRLDQGFGFYFDVDQSDLFSQFYKGS